MTKQTNKQTNNSVSELTIFYKFIKEPLGLNLATHIMKDL